MDAALMILKEAAKLALGIALGLALYHRVVDPAIGKVQTALVPAASK